MKKQAVQRLLSLAPYQPGRPIDEVKRELGLRSVIKLASNESPFGPSPRVLKAIEKAALDVNRYPDGGCFYLRQEVSKQLSVKAGQLVFGNGSDELIILALRSFVNPGDEILVSDPSFMVYSIGGKAVGAKVRVVPMKDFHHDLKALAAAVTENTKIIFLDNPGNPAGTYITDQALRDFLTKIPSRVVVFLDEAYYEYACLQKDYPCSLSWISQYPNVIVARTFSKIYALAGLRVGYALASLSCTFGVILAVIAQAQATYSYAGLLLVFGVYAAGSATVLLLLALATAAAGSGLTRHVARLARHGPRVTA
ncbi:MAG TPA: aminotransferase class I/II-fold pyridoxal phosphate-dependent enzyme, partial [Candidatus Omnitrophota bacterium]|nr:aminotransferase class I/II-fold pyridoxal phosphate-dependent enzyme [Candidatus Omnitrophota bacterium]